MLAAKRERGGGGEREKNRGDRIACLGFIMTEALEMSDRCWSKPAMKRHWVLTSCY